MTIPTPPWTREDVKAGRARCEHCHAPLSHLIPGAAVRIIDAILPCEVCGQDNRIVLAPSRPRTAFRVKVGPDFRAALDSAPEALPSVLYDGGSWARIDVPLDEVESVARAGRIHIRIGRAHVEAEIIEGPEDPLL